MTVIFRPAFFLLSGLLLAPSCARAQTQVALTLDSIQHPAFNAEGIRVDVAVTRSAPGQISIHRLRGRMFDLRDLRVLCRPLRVDLEGIECTSGRVTQAGQGAVDVSFSYRYAGQRLALTIKQADLAVLRGIAPALNDVNLKGRGDFDLALDRSRAELTVKLNDAGFSNAEASRAGEAIAAEFHAVATRNAAAWNWRASLDWPSGEAYWAPWYRKAGMHGEAQGTLASGQFDINQFRLTAEGLGSMTAAVRWDLARLRPLHWGFVTDDIDFGRAVAEWIQPWLDQYAFPKLEASGRTRLSGEWADGALQAFFIGLDGASLADAAGHLRFAGVHATIPWLRDQTTRAALSADTGHWGDLALGGFEIPVQLHGADAQLQALSIPLLDGRVYVDRLHAFDSASGWQWDFSGGIEGLSMPKVSSALKLPRMEGSVTARIPAARYHDGEVSFDGALLIDVFGGRITASNLRVVDPFGRTQRFLADVEMRNVDLGQLTGAFSFGSIRGRFDGELKGLEMQGWKPIRFDAHLASSPGDYKRSISRGALQDISAIGGASGAQAIRESPAGLFNNFSYDRIALGCRLRNGVCTLDGIAREEQGIVLVQGSGIPSVKVIGYNRNVDWSLLVDRIRAVIAGKSKAVIE